MRIYVKKVFIMFLYSCKYTGMFFLCRCLTKKAVRILCYHNFCSGKIAEWRPSLSIDPVVFNKRLKYLRDKNYEVLCIDEAVELLSANDISKPTVVITIDDGWKSIVDVAHPILKKYGIPYTVYLTTYYAENGGPLFNLAIKFMFYHCFTLGYDFCKLRFPPSFILPVTADYESLASGIITYGNQLSFVGRLDLLKDLAKQLNFDFDKSFSSGLLSIMSMQDVAILAQDGVDFQLHTHRHNFPDNSSICVQELQDNIDALRVVVEKKMSHFCYPNGVWNVHKFEVLKMFGMKSATTLREGLNYSITEPLSLSRFSDSGMLPQIVFEAKMSGFYDVFFINYFSKSLKRLGVR